MVTLNNMVCKNHEDYISVMAILLKKFSVLDNFLKSSLVKVAYFGKLLACVFFKNTKKNITFDSAEPPPVF